MTGIDDPVDQRVERRREVYFEDEMIAGYKEDPNKFSSKSAWQVSSCPIGIRNHGH